MTHHTGSMKTFNREKGFGFVIPDTGGLDVFVHISALHRSGWDDVPEPGTRVRYTLRPRGEHRTQIDLIKRDEA